MKKGLCELIVVAIAILMFFLFSIKDPKKPYFQSTTISTTKQYKPQTTTKPFTTTRTTNRSTTVDSEYERVFDDDDDYDNPDYDQDEVDELENY